MNIDIPDLSDDAVAALARDLNEHGFATIADFVSPADLSRMQAFVAEAVRKAGNEYAGFTGAHEVTGSGLDRLAHSPSFRRLIERVHAAGTGRPAVPLPYYQVLRCLAGRSARVHSYLYHYDSYVLTVLIPIVVPTSGQPGDFILLPNTRRIRARYITNVADKILLDNRLTQWLLHRLVKAGIVRAKRLGMVPGSALFFWGYRSIHTNEPCDPDQVRATALFHYDNPHADAAKLSGTRKLAA